MQGHCDESTLTEAGQLGASQAGVALQDLQFDAVYCSPFQRARETAGLILASLNHKAPAELKITDDLREISLPLWEGLSFQEVEDQHPELYQCWRDRPHELQMPLVTAEGTQNFYPVIALYEQAKSFGKKFCQTILDKPFWRSPIVALIAVLLAPPWI